MIYFQVHRTYILRDDITGQQRDFKDQVGIARFDNPFDAKNFIARTVWTEDDLSHPCLQWDCSHEEMVKQGWDLEWELDKEPTEAVDSGLLEGDEVPVVVRIGRGFAGIGKVMAVLPTLPPNPWLYGHNPNTSKAPKLFTLLPDGGRFVDALELRTTEATNQDSSYYPILPAAKALIESFGKKMVQYPRITEEHNQARKRAYENAGDISIGNYSVSGHSQAHVSSFNRIIDLG